MIPNKHTRRLASPSTPRTPSGSRPRVVLFSSPSHVREREVKNEERREKQQRESDGEREDLSLKRVRASAVSDGLVSSMGHNIFDAAAAGSLGSDSREILEQITILIESSDEEDDGVVELEEVKEEARRTNASTSSSASSSSSVSSSNQIRRSLLSPNPFQEPPLPPPNNPRLPIYAGQDRNVGGGSSPASDELFETVRYFAERIKRLRDHGMRSNNRYRDTARVASSLHIQEGYSGKVCRKIGLLSKQYRDAGVDIDIDTLTYVLASTMGKEKRKDMK